MITLIPLLFYELKSKKTFTTAVVAALVVPLIFVLALGPLTTLFFSERFGAVSLPLAIVDLEQSFYTRLFVNELITSPGIREHIDVTLTDEQQAFALLDDNAIAGIVVIPADFTHQMRAGLFEPMVFHMNPARPYQAQLIAEGLNSGVYLMSAVQNTLYMVYGFAAFLPMTPAERQTMFEMQMLRLITTAMNRHEIYTRTPIAPWGGAGMAAYYGVAIMLILMALMGCKGIAAYFDQGEQVYVRMRLAGAPRCIRAVACFLYTSFLIFGIGMAIGVPVMALTADQLLTTAGLLRLLRVLGQIAPILAALCLLTAVLAKKPFPAILGWLTFVAAALLISGSVVPLHFLPDFIPNNSAVVSPFYWFQQMVLDTL